MTTRGVRPVSRGKALLTMAWDVGAPIGAYYLLHGLGMSTFLALLLAAVLPGLTSVHQVIRAGKLDGLGVFMVSVTVASALASLVSGSPRFLLAKDGLLTAFGGTWLLVTAWDSRPVVFMFARALLEGRVGPHGESWDLLWERLPGFRRIWRVAGVIWGVATIADAAVRFGMAYLLPVNEVPALNGIQWAVLFILLQVVTNIYYHRAGLYNPRSALYAPLRQPGPPESTVDTNGAVERTATIGHGPAGEVAHSEPVTPEPSPKPSTGRSRRSRCLGRRGATAGRTG